MSTRDEITERKSEIIERIAYRSLLKKRKRTTGISGVRNKIKSRLRYRKNKWKMKTYNKKYRQRNKLRLQRQRRMRNKLK